MKEADWFSTGKLKELVKFVAKKRSTRKLRLFGVACARHLFHLLDDERYRNAVDVGERFAEGQASNEERARAFRLAGNARRFIDGEYADGGPGRDKPRSFAYFAASFASAAHATTAASNVSAYVWRHFRELDRKNLGAAEILLHQTLQDIFGNPFREILTLDRAWLRWHDAAIPRLAQQMYDSRDFNSMPILADALEEAGCTSADILDHCRGLGPHVRGCWVIDLLLGKE